MPHKTQSQSADKKQGHDTREPDDFEEGDRTSQVGRGGAFEIEESRTRSSRGGADEDDDDIDDIDEIDLDAAPEGDGPDA